MDEIMTVEELAKYLRVQPQTIYTWVQGEKIPGVKIGKEWRFKRSIIDKWFDSQLHTKFKDMID
jgi:excisionase family DNA binding protein